MPRDLNRATLISARTFGHAWMLNAAPTTPEGIRLAAQLEIAVERNAHLMVALRHAMHELHLEQVGHEHAKRWPFCKHPRCQSAALLLGEPNETKTDRPERR